MTYYPEQAPAETETTPLLNPPQENHTDDNDATPPKSRSTLRVTLSVIILIAAITLILDFAGYFGYAPQLEIFEKIICRDYYTTQGTLGAGESWNSRDCKIQPVQAELAIINGWKDTFDTIPGILFALPFGALGDQIGRKPVLLLGMFGSLMADGFIKVVCWLSPAVPLRTVWFSSLFYLVGGGPQTATAMMFVMIADVCPADKRATAFSQLHAAILLSEISATPISAALMSINPWLPFLIGFGLSVIGTITALFIPETFQVAKQNGETAADRATAVSASADEPLHRQSLSGKILNELKKSRQSTAVLWKNWNVMLILLVFFVSYLGRQSLNLVLQYASKRYHWSIAEASYLMSLRGTVNLLVLLVLLPTISAFLESRHSFNTATIEKILTQVSLFLLFCGLLMVFFAYRPVLIFLGLIIFALGSSFAVTARSLVSALVKKEALGTVFSAIGVVTSGGMLVAGPLLANTFRWGMSLGTFWMGLPFLVAGLLYTVAFISISLVRLNGVQSN